jgi:predicted ATPase with chaperone activity
MVCINRTQASVELPARFTLAATGNFCPCGGLPPFLPQPDPLKTNQASARCICKKSTRDAYLAKFSGPILDRVDLLNLVIPTSSPESPGAVTDLDRLRARIQSAQMRMLQTYGVLPTTFSSAELEAFISEHPRLQNTLGTLRLASLRSRHKALRIAITIAALDEETEVCPHHLEEAALYRPERLGFFS